MRFPPSPCGGLNEIAGTTAEIEQPAALWQTAFQLRQDFVELGQFRGVRDPPVPGDHPFGIAAVLVTVGEAVGRELRVDEHHGTAETPLKGVSPNNAPRAGSGSLHRLDMERGSIPVRSSSIRLRPRGASRRQVLAKISGSNVGGPTKSIALGCRIVGKWPSVSDSWRRAAGLWLSEQM